MPTNDIKLIVMDMDGTLLNSDQEISQANVAALKRAREMGVRLAICSGRTYGDTMCYLAASGLGDCAVLSLNGAYCLLGGEQVAYEEHELPPDTARACVELLAFMRVDFGCYWHNQIAYVMEDADAGAWSKLKPSPYAAKRMYGLEKVASLEGANKIVCVNPNPARLADVRARLEALGGMTVTSSWFNNLEIVPVGVNKGAAVCGLAERLGLSLSQVMACGDNDNDLTMIECAGLGVAMGNATDAIKTAARFVRATNDEDGVARAIECFVLHS